MHAHFQGRTHGQVEAIHRLPYRPSQVFPLRRGIGFRPGSVARTPGVKSHTTRLVFKVLSSTLPSHPGYIQIQISQFQDFRCYCCTLHLTHRVSSFLRCGGHSTKVAVLRAPPHVILRDGKYALWLCVPCFLSSQELEYNIRSGAVASALGIPWMMRRANVTHTWLHPNTFKL